MIKVYAVALALGVAGLIWMILGGALAGALDRPDRDPAMRIGDRGKMAVGAVVGFGMGGMSAEFSPLDLTWPVALLVAIGAAAVSVAWVAYSTRRVEG